MVSEKNHIVELYERLAKKYSFLLDKLKVIQHEVDGMAIQIKKLQETISNVILEVTQKFPI